MSDRLEIAPIAIEGEVAASASVADLVQGGLAARGISLASGDVVVVAQKIVSKAEGRALALVDIVAGDRAQAMARESGKDARVLEAVLRESRRIVRWNGSVLIAETRHGFVCANAGVDRSNAGAIDEVVLLPVDPDASAARVRDILIARTGADVGVIVSDTFGRAWRNGHANVAIGCAGVPLYVDGPRVRMGRPTGIAVADELAAAAELVMGKLERIPVALVRGLHRSGKYGGAREYVRPSRRDLFR